MNNLFNVDPPACFSCGLNNMDPTTYDVPGRFFYARVLGEDEIRRSPSHPPPGFPARGGAGTAAFRTAPDRGLNLPAAAPMLAA